MRLVCRQLPWEGVSTVSTVPRVQHRALSAAASTGQVFQAREECRGQGKEGEGSLHPAKQEAETVSADSVVPPPELCTLEHSLLGFVRYYLQVSEPTRDSLPGRDSQGQERIGLG